MAERPGRRRARISADIGGTFTDLVLLRDGAIVSTAKVLTTPNDPSGGVYNGIQDLMRGHDPAEAAEVVHGTTLVSNALIERKGARTCLVTTKGFRDVLAIGREHRYELYDLFIELPEPLVPRQRRFELTERVLADGTVEVPVDRDEVRSLVPVLREQHIEAVAVCFLHSYRYSSHEEVVAEILRAEMPELSVSISSHVVPELGEYTRMTTTTGNAYVQPVFAAYLNRLERSLGELDVDAPLHVMLSTGGLASAAVAMDYPVRLVESGPSAGVLSAAFFGAGSGSSDVLAFDMGGTTAKACLVEGGTPLQAREIETARVYRFAKGSGIPLRVPGVDLIEIGAGGGSIARVGPFKLPKVGPQSAAGDPGPACYGRGGTDPTVTDADLILGFLNPTFFLGGKLELDVDAAERAVGELAGDLGLALIEAAAGVHRVVNENMANAARMHAIERGRDLRRYSLVATGGAGPVHAWGVATALGIRRILFPPNAGVASAFGMLTAQPAFDFVRSLPGALADTDWDTVGTQIAAMRAEGAHQLRGLGVPNDMLEVRLGADVRHRGQGETLVVALEEGLEKDPAPQVEAAFEDRYVTLYGRRPPGVPLEVLTWRVRVSGPRPELGLGEGRAETRGTLKVRRKVWFPDQNEWIEVDVLDRYAVAPGDVLRGPAIFEEVESTAVVGPGASIRVIDGGSLEVTIHD